LRLCAARVRRQKEIAHVRAGQIDLGADLVKSAETPEKCLANLSILATDAVQHNQRADGRGDSEDQQTPKPKGGSTRASRVLSITV